MEGFIKLYRSLLDWEWYKDINTRLVFIHLLLNANWENSKFKGIDIPKGSLVVGRKQLADKIGISEQSIRTSLEHLKSTNEITIESTNKFSVITLINWEKYQGYTEESTNKATNKTPTTNQQLTTEEEYNNIRIKENNNVRKTENAQKLMNLYHEHCPSLPKVMKLTDTRKKLANARLKEYSEEQIIDVFNKAQESDFLRNGSGTWKGADFEWILKPNNFVKILEGNYKNKSTQPKKNQFNNFQQSSYDWDEINKELGIK